MQRKLLGLYVALVVAAAAAGSWPACAAQQPQQQQQTRPSAAASEQRLQAWPRKQQRHPGGGGAGAGSLARPASDDVLASGRNGQSAGAAAAAAAPARAGYYHEVAEASDAAQSHSAASAGFHHEPAASLNTSSRARRVQDDKKLAKLFYQKLGSANLGGFGAGFGAGFGGGFFAEEERRGRTAPAATAASAAAAASSQGSRHIAGFSEYMTIENDDPLESNGRSGSSAFGDSDAGGDDDSAVFRGEVWSPVSGDVYAQASSAGIPQNEDAAVAGAAGLEHAGTATTGACPNCQLMREEALAFRIEAIKQDILSKLQLEKPPNVTRRQRDPRIPKHLLYPDNAVDHDADDAETGSTPDEEYATIERVFRFAEKAPDEKSVPSASSADTLYFDMPKQVLGAKIRRAKLGVYAHCLDDCGRATVTVKVFDAAPGSSREPVSSQKTSVDRRGRWIHLDVTTLLEAWAVDPESNYGVVAVAEVPSGTGAVRLSGIADEEERKAFLDIHIGSSSSGRRKRDLGLECTESSAEERCCRYPFTVDFDEFGPSFDFIITPRRYPANYCAGQCPPAFLPMHTNTHLTQVSRRLPANSRQPCCTPRKLDGVFMVYVDDFGTYMQGVLPGMTIKSCGCS